jgi:hypothetical protein
MWRSGRERSWSGWETCSIRADPGPVGRQFATAPAGMHHFSIARGRTVLAVTFTGPYTITYVRAEDALRPRVFPSGY